MVYILEIILFKGKTHSKRGAGLTIIPEKVLKFDICKGINLQKDIRTIFISQFREKISQYNEVKRNEENRNEENSENNLYKNE